MIISATSLVKESWKIYKDNFLLFLKITIWFLVPIAAWTVVSLMDFKKIILVPISIFSSIAYLILWIFLSVALTIIVDKILKTENIDFKLIFSLSYSKIISYLWVYILKNLVFLSVIAIPAIIGIAISKLIVYIPVYVFLLVSLALITVTLIIIIAVLLSLSPPSAILNNKGGWSALVESKNIIKNNFWGITWRWFVNLLFYSLPLFLIITAISFIDFIFSKVLSAQYTDLITQIFYHFFMLPLLVIASVLLYNSLKKEKRN